MTEAKAPLRGVDVGVQFLTSLFVGGGLGYLLDWGMGWAPWGLLAGLFLGFAAWLRVLWKVIQRA